VSDPFAGLDTDWAKDVERRAVRAARLQRLRRGFRRPRRSGRLGTSTKLLLIGAAAALAVAVSFGASSFLPDGPSTSRRPPGIPRTPHGREAVSGPFEGTAAARFPMGLAGIQLPPAAAVDGFTAAQVDDALRTVRLALVAGRLDPEMLVAHEPSRLLGLIDEAQREQARGWFAGGPFANVATWIDPDADLDPTEQPRVSGRITYAAVEVEGVRALRVTTNFVWVYPFSGAGLAAPYAAVHDHVDWDFPAGHGMRVSAAESYFVSMDCRAATRGLLAPRRTGADGATGTAASGATGAAASGAADGSPADWLKPDHALTGGRTCNEA
jgi:hypothetical protein